MVFAPDPEAMRQQFARQMALQRQQALRGVQDIYAQRGTTGGGEEAQAFGQLGQQFGAAAGAQEAQLQQYLGNLGQQQAQMQQQESQFGRNLGQQESQFGRNLGEQIAGRQQQESQFGRNLGEQIAGRQQQVTQFGQTLGEQQRQFNVGNFGNVAGTGESLNAQSQLFNQRERLAQLYAGGILGRNPADLATGSNPFAAVLNPQEQNQNDPMFRLAQRLGYASPEEMQIAQGADEGKFRDLLWQEGITDPAKADYRRTLLKQIIGGQ